MAEKVESNDAYDNGAEANGAGASSGHGLGQLIGDWWEQYVALPVLTQAATELNLFVDNRFKSRSVRDGEKILWKDHLDNEVDYDFVFELNGTDAAIGIPVAFFECCWRRGGRHSRDKVRDDCGKLLPMRESYATTRALALLWSGDFTKPARQYALDRQVRIFFIPKSTVIEAFSENDLIIDYSDRAPEEEKLKVKEAFVEAFNQDIAKNVATSLRKLAGQAVFDAFVAEVKAMLSALPVEIVIRRWRSSKAYTFDTIEAAGEFLKKPEFEEDGTTEQFEYEVTYSDGSDYDGTVPTLEALRELHDKLALLTTHISKQT